MSLTLMLMVPCGSYWRVFLVIKINEDEIEEPEDEMQVIEMWVCSYWHALNSL